MLLRGWFVGLAVAVCSAGVAGEPGKAVVKAENFRLLDHAGRSHELYRHGGDKAAVVLYTFGPDCARAAEDLGELTVLRDHFAPLGVLFFLITPHTAKERADLVKQAEALGIDIPILLDDTELVLRALGFTHTNEAIVVRPGTWDIVYRGAVQDEVKEKPGEIARHLGEALLALQEQRAIASANTAPRGCALELKPLPAEVSYVKDIAPLLEKRCTSCHSEGNIGPFAFSSYKKAKGWGSMIRETVLTQQMPPWHADPAHNAFVNDRSLTVEEKRKLIAWIEAGSPKDGDEDPLALEPGKRTEEWALGPPDHVIALPEIQHIRAEGVEDYRYIEVPSGLREDKWLRGFDVQPTNRKVTHHVLVFIEYPRGSNLAEPESLGGLDGFFAGYVPGTDPVMLPPDTGKLVPAGSSFIFQIHYTTTGKPETDFTRMAMYFHDAPPRQEMATRAAANVAFMIPPGHPDSETTGFHYVMQDSLLWGMSPHMHYRGSRFKYEAVYPDGKRETLVSVPNYHFDWQTTYQFDPPKKLPQGTRILATGAFDNSAMNPYNPDPKATVFFGEQTFEEMFIGYLHYSYPAGSGSETALSMRSGLEAAPIPHSGPLDARTIVGTQWRVDEYVLSFEQDGVTINGIIRGSWVMEGDLLRVVVLGETYQFVIRENGLFTDGGEALARLV